MKVNRKLALVVILGLIQPIVAHADNLFRLSWRGKVYTSGPAGVVVRRCSEKDFVQKVATDNGLDPNSLVFVYRADKHDTAVVRAADGAFVADVLQMEYNYTEATNGTATQTVRQALLYDEAHTNALGSVFGTEKVKRDATGKLIAYSFRGTFQYSVPENDMVYSGTFVAGKRVVDTSSPQDTSSQDTSAQPAQ
jgi:hypothetical protein